MSKLKDKLYEIVFEADTPKGKAFDVLLLFTISVSILVVMLESVPGINKKYAETLYLIEWIITGFFTIEYFLRIWIVKKPVVYIFSFYGIIDFLSVIPSYLGLIFGGMSGFIVIRALRLLRIFRILKLSRYVSASKTIMTALKASRAKISVFLYSVIMLVVIIGTVMYFVEGEENGFTSIPQSIYWAIVTLTTVGYGDIAPVTPVGQFIASLVMILGYGIIAVPTGIVSTEMALASRKEKIITQVCPNCLHEDHDEQAVYCNRCGSLLNE
ncbi:MAG: ion transporter [Bacteroidales bacterium]|nr:ion transporter [Bacteroidales bacterium]